MMTAQEFGTLHPGIGGAAAALPAEADKWADKMFNSSLVVVSALLLLVFLPMIIRFFPALANFFSRARGAVEIEHNLHLRKTRNRLAILMIPPFLTIVDRFSLYSPQWLDSIHEEWRLAVVASVISGFFLLRALISIFAVPKRMGEDEVAAVRNSIFTVFVALAMTLTVAAWAMYTFEVRETLSRQILTGITALFYFFSVTRAGYFLGQRCSGLTTILYLCALEILPAGVLIVSATAL